MGRPRRRRQQEPSPQRQPRPSHPNQLPSLHLNDRLLAKRPLLLLLKLGSPQFPPQHRQMLRE